VVAQRGPLLLVAVSSGGEPTSALRRRLDLLHSQVSTPPPLLPLSTTLQPLPTYASHLSTRTCGSACGCASARPCEVLAAHVACRCAVILVS
jgi:hypothetical protein